MAFRTIFWRKAGFGLSSITSPEANLIGRMRRILTAFLSLDWSAGNTCRVKPIEEKNYEGPSFHQGVDVSNPNGASGALPLRELGRLRRIPTSATDLLLNVWWARLPFCPSCVWIALRPDLSIHERYSTLPISKEIPSREKWCANETAGATTLKKKTNKISVCVPPGQAVLLGSSRRWQMLSRHRVTPC